MGVNQLDINKEEWSLPFLNWQCSDVEEIYLTFDKTCLDVVCLILLYTSCLKILNLILCISLTFDNSLQSFTYLSTAYTG